MRKLRAAVEPEIELLLRAPKRQSRNVEMHDLAKSVNTGVSAPRAREVCLGAKARCEDSLELSGDGSLAVLNGKSMKRAAVICNGEDDSSRRFKVNDGALVWRGDRFFVVALAHRGHRPFDSLQRLGEVEERHTNSTRAMGALSPGRGPSFKMRK